MLLASCADVMCTIVRVGRIMAWGRGCGVMVKQQLWVYLYYRLTIFSESALLFLNTCLHTCFISDRKVQSKGMGGILIPCDVAV